MQQNCKKDSENGQKTPIFRPPLGTNGIENILNASSIVVLWYRKYLVQKGSLFDVTLGNYATKTAKKNSKKLWKWPKIAYF